MSKNPANRIPKIIHYCWFGGSPKPTDIQACIDSWAALSDYQIIEWNESNCSFDENDYIKKAYAEKKWAFVADFYRLVALDKMGGIYLDTDVKVFRDFSPLLHHEVFLNFIFDCSIGSAVIGAAPGSKLIKELLDMYYRTEFTPHTENHTILAKDGKYFIRNYVPNNYYFTYHIIKNYPAFLLNNKYQDLGDFAIYPKELFEIGSLLNKHYTIHYCTGTWKPKKKPTRISAFIQSIAKHFPKLFHYLQIVNRKRRYQKMLKSIPFYPQYLAQKNGTSLPEL